MQSKAAVLFCGFLRCQEHTVESYQKYLLQSNDVDIFVSTWDIDDIIRPEIGLVSPGPVKIDKFLGMYSNNVKDYVVRPYEMTQITLPEVKELRQSPYDCFKTNPRAIKHGIVWANRIISMWYLISKGIRLMKNYEERTGILYDIVLRTRTDLMLTDSLLFKGTIAKNTIYGDGEFYNWDGNPSSQLCSDIFLGDSRTVECLSGLYKKSIDFYMRQNLDISNSESLFYTFCVQKDIFIEKTSFPYKRVKPCQFEN